MALRLEIRCLSCMGPSCSVINDRVLFLCFGYLLLPDWGLMFLVGGGFIVVLNQGLTLQRPVWPRNHYATQAGLELKATLLPQPPKCWHKSPYLIFCFGLVFETAAQATLQLKTFFLLLECWDYRHVSAWLKTPGLFIYLHLFGFVFCCVLFGGYDLECEWRSANNLQH